MIHSLVPNLTEVIRKVTISSLFKPVSRGALSFEPTGQNLTMRRTRELMEKWLKPGDYVVRKELDDLFEKSLNRRMPESPYFLKHYEKGTLEIHINSFCEIARSKKELANTASPCKGTRSISPPSRTDRSAGTFYVT